MKTYLETIEGILGAELEPERIGAFGFDTVMVKRLKAFAEEYGRKKVVFDDEEPCISCYMAYPELLTGDFRTYEGKGELGGHWPVYEELAGLALLCDRVVLFDHLPHYASTALSGYVRGYRYDGLRNWLMRLAAWRPFIADGSLCVVPQDLAISGPVQELWNEGEMQYFAGEVFYRLHPDAGDFRNGAEGEELLYDMMDLENYLTELSIAVSRNARQAHYFNDPGETLRHEDLVRAVMDQIRAEFLERNPSAEVEKDFFAGQWIARLAVPLDLRADRYTPADLAELKSGHADLAAARKSIRQCIREFSQEATFFEPSGERFQKYLLKKEKEIAEHLAGFHTGSGKRFTFGFAGMRLMETGGRKLPMAAAGMKSTFNNLPVKAQLPGSLCHYFISSA